MKRRRAAVRLATAALALAVSAPAGAGPPERLLLIALDAVPYSTVAKVTDPKLGAEALFQGFSGPAELVSSFPSTTNIAMAGLLAPFGVAPSPGYEARYFDLGANRLRGGGPISYHQLVFPWRERFDWQQPSLVSGMVSKLVPVRSTENEIAAALREFSRSPAPVYLIYIANTDGVAHLESPAALRQVLVALDRDLERLRREPGGDRFHVVLFSDHGIAGGEPLVNVRGEVRERLRGAGFWIGNRLEDSQDVVIAELGMVSNFEVHTQPGYEGRAAAAAVEAAGVGLCAYRNGGDGGDGWEVVAAAGSAWFGRRPSNSGSGDELWAYRPRTGDPLGYAPIVDRLTAEAGEAGRSGRSGEGDWFPGDAWFAATVDSRYPDALHRLARSFELVENPASIACSVAPGFLYGALRTATVARMSIGHLRWTHGALDREPSLGFLMSDLPGWRAPAAVRFDRALVPFARAAAAIEARAAAADEGEPTAVALSSPW